MGKNLCVCFRWLKLSCVTVDKTLAVKSLSPLIVVFTGAHSCLILSQMSQICIPLHSFSKINFKIIHPSTPTFGGGPFRLDLPKNLYVFSISVISATEQVNLAVIIYTCIQVLSVSNLDWDTGYYDVFDGFPHLIKVDSRIIP